MTKRERNIGIIMAVVITGWLISSLTKEKHGQETLATSLGAAGTAQQTTAATTNLPPLDLVKLKGEIERGLQPHGTGEIRDPFVPIKPPLAEEKEDAFDVNRFKLMGVFFEGNAPNAVINDQIVREGDTIDEGCTVETITATKVTIARGPARFILKLYPDVKKQSEGT